MKDMIYSIFYISIQIVNKQLSYVRILAGGIFCPIHNVSAFTIHVGNTLTVTWRGGVRVILSHGSTDKSYFFCVFMCLN